MSSVLVAVTDKEVAKTTTSFLALYTCWRRGPFVVVITRDIGRVRFFRSGATLFQVVSCVDSGGWDGILLIFSSVPPTLLLLLPSFFGALSIISALSCHFLSRSKHRSLGLGIVLAMIFHCSLSLDFLCGDVGRLISLGDLVIGLLYVRIWS